MDENITYKHDFLETVIKATIVTFDFMFAEYRKRHLNSKDFPIYILNSGDSVFLTNMTDYGNDVKMLYEKTPRMVLSLGDINLDTAQLSSSASTSIVVNVDGVNVKGKTSAKRLPLGVVLKSRTHFNKITEYLTFVEYFLSVYYSHTMSFPFSHNGITYTVYIKPISDYNSESNFNMGFDSEGTNKVLEMNWQLDVQMPAFNIYDVKNLQNIELEYTPNVYFDGDYPNRNVMNDGTCGSGRDSADVHTWKHRLFINTKDPSGFVSETIIKGKK